MNRDLLSILALTALLAACGGGGGGGTGTAVTPAPVDPFVPSTITVATTLPTYPGGSEELAAFNTLNNARTTCGFGGLNQNTVLDQAALNHNFYMATNNVFGHGETPGLPGYTGSNSNDRATAAGYPLARQSFSENLAGNWGSAVTKAGFGAVGMTRLLSAPYHLEGLVGPHREVGISVRSSGATGSGADYIVSGFLPGAWLSSSSGSTSTLPAQRQSSTDVLTYPCQGITGAAYQLRDETPNPVTPRNLLTNPIGHPIFIQLLLGRVLVVTSVSVTGPAGSVALLPTMTYANDPNFLLSPHQAIVMPNLPMTPNTTYSVVINGTNNGTPFTRSFTFSTGTIG